MKIGKQPKRFGGPSQKFLDRKAAEKAAVEDVNRSRAPKTGAIGLFLDDERNPPENWTLLRSPYAFLEAIQDPEINPRVERISLDWYLGAGIHNGEVVAKDLAIRLLDPNFLPNLEIIHFHSSDHTRARAMFKSISDELGARGDKVMLDIGMPWDIKS